MGRLENKIALITGGCGAIGAETARLFAREGADVTIVDVRDKEGIKLQNQYGLTYYHLDVRQEEGWKGFIEVFRQKHSSLDILFNNAGIFGLTEISSPQNPELMSLDDWHYIHQVNLDSIFLSCKHLLPLMKEKGGSIINMSSRAAFIGVPSAAAYASTKAAICNYTKSVALYCAEKHYAIRCNSLHPGIIDTPLWNPILQKEESVSDKMLANIPLGRLGVAHEVACAALYLASDDSQYVTGTELTIDGGMSAGRVSNPIVCK